MTKAEARKSVLKFDSLITDRMCDIEDIEYEIEELLRSRKHFIKVHAKKFTADELTRIKAEWPHVK